MPDAVPQINLNDTHHLEHLTWAMYDRALLVGSRSELPGDHQWCTVLAGIFKHIYKGHDDAATLATLHASLVGLSTEDQGTL